MYKNQLFKKIIFLLVTQWKVAFQAKVLSATFLLCVTSQIVWAQFQLVVEISNVKSEEGNIAVALYNTESGFMKSPFEGKKIKATKGSMEIVFEGIPAGIYALSAMHDANQNGKLDNRPSGIPKEGFGFSNNALSKLGVPKFEKAKFELAGNAKIQITLRYIEPHRKKESEP